jgi:hypothetical protein
MKPPSPFERPLDQEPDREPQWPWQNMSEKSQPSEAEKPDIKKKVKEKTDKHEQGAKEEKQAPKKDTKKQQTESKKAEGGSKRQEEASEADEEKEEKRTRLVEQSAAYTKHFEENPLPHDPTVLARLLIAQHVLALHEQLEHPADDQSATNSAQLLATLDHMGALDDKFQDPSVEASPDIEDAYEEIMQLARKTLQEGENLDDVVAANNANTRQDNTTSDQSTPPTPSTPSSQPKITQRKPDTVPPSAARSSAAAGLIYAIAHLRDRKKQPDQSLKPEGQASLADIADRIPPSPYSAESTSSTSRHSVDSIARPSSYREITTSRPVTTREYAPITTPERHISSRRSSPAILAAAAIATSAAVSSRHPESRPHIDVLPPSLDEQPSRIGREASSTQPVNEINDSRKIEHMPLNTLLRMAETVPVGHGHYLRRAYETGQIDKEGLIKILKSHKKGRDFFVEYRQQEARVRALRTQSPEFLPSAVAATTLAKDSSYQPTSQPLSPKNTVEKTPESVSSATPPSHPQPLLPSLAQAARNKPPTAWRLIILTLATVATITLIGVIVFGLYSQFSS